MANDARTRTCRTLRFAHVHDAPSAMALVLILLAIGSAVAGYVGVPSCAWRPEPAWRMARAIVPGSPSVAGGFQAETAVAGGLQASERRKPRLKTPALELRLMAISSAIAIAGIALAAFIWLRAAIWQRQLRRASGVCIGCC